MQSDKKGDTTQQTASTPFVHSEEALIKAITNATPRTTNPRQLTTEQITAIVNDDITSPHHPNNWIIDANDPGPTHASTGLKQSAVALAHKGFKIFPLKPKGKSPILSGSWLSYATSDLKQIEAWWANNSTYNIAIPASLNGIFVLDVDNKKHNGHEELAELERKYSVLPRTLRACTPTDGMHYYFRMPAGEPLHNIQVNEKGEGGIGGTRALECKALNGYVAAAPSVGSNGNVYSWFSEDPIAEAPTWLLDLIREQNANSFRHPLDSRLTGDNIVEGERDGTLYRIACKLRGAGWEYEEIHAHLERVNRDRCQPPLDSWIVAQKAKSACKYSAGNSIKIQPILSESIGQNSLCIGQNTPRELPVAAGAIEPAKVIQIPELTQDVLYGRCGELSLQLNIPLGYSYPALVTAYSAKGVKPHKTTRTNLYTCLVGPIHSGKTVAIEQALEICDVSPGAIVKSVTASDRGVIEALQETTGGNVIFSPDEFDAVLKKSKIQNSTLASLLCRLWSSDEAGNATKAGNVKVQARVSILGGIPCASPSDFADMFGRETRGGLEDRFVYGFTNQTMEYEEPSYSICYSTPALCSLVPENWERLKEWRRQKISRGRLGENALRWALVTSSANGDCIVTDEALKKALRFMEWQEQFRKLYKPSRAKNQNAECLELMNGFFEDAATGMTFGWRDLARQKHWYDFGSGIAKSCLQALVDDGTIFYDQRTGTITIL